jgi:hypothetical protein
MLQHAAFVLKYSIITQPKNHLLKEYIRNFGEKTPALCRGDRALELRMQKEPFTNTGHITSYLDRNFSQPFQSNASTAPSNKRRPLLSKLILLVIQQKLYTPFGYT